MWIVCWIVGHVRANIYGDSICLIGACVRCGAVDDVSRVLRPERTTHRVLWAERLAR